jgi:hypothetical protein
MASVDLRHHGNPLVATAVVGVMVPNVDLQWVVCGVTPGVPLKVAASIVPSIAACVFLISLPVIDTFVHSANGSPFASVSFDTTSVFVARMQIPGFPEQVFPVGSSTVLPSSTVIFEAEALAGRANAASAATAMQAMMIFFDI